MRHHRVLGLPARMGLRPLAVVVGLGMAVAIAGPAAPAQAAPTARYIVTTTSSSATDSKVKRLRAAKAPIGRQFRHALDGFSATLTDAQVAQLTSDPSVESVRKVTRVKASEVTGASITQTWVDWGLDRIDQREGQDTSYTYATTGAGVTAYVIDTGIRMDHEEFQGRLVPGFDFVDNDADASDCPSNYEDDLDAGLISHGTHVAGIVGGTVYGVAKKVSISSLRVLGCDGTGGTDSVIAALDWVIDHHPSTPSVVNLSLGGNVDADLDAAVRAVVAAGIPVVVAAGNEGQDACNSSPADVSAALTVGASDASDHRAYWSAKAASNYGACLDLFAPGDVITSAGSYTAHSAIGLSGTSMAAPHVTGAVARYLQAYPRALPAQVGAAILGNASSIGIGDDLGSPDRLLYVPVESVPGPVKVTASRNDKARTATVSWGAPTSTGGATVTGYRVVRTGKDAAGRTSRTVDVAAGSRSYTFTGLVPGATYILAVQARNVVGWGAGASTKQTMTALPGRPTIASATSGSKKDKKTSINVSWSRPTSGGPVKSYVVTATRNSTGSVKTVTVSGSARRVTVSGLKKNKKYTIRVRATNDSGSGASVTWKKSVKAR